MNKKDLYGLLNITKNATTEDIKKSYKKMALKYHPDRNSSHDATEKFNEIKEAYEILSDPLKRKEYDYNSVSMPNLESHWRSSYTNMVMKTFDAMNESLIRQMYGSSPFFEHVIIIQGVDSDLASSDNELASSPEEDGVFDLWETVVNEDGTVSRVLNDRDLDRIVRDKFRKG